MANDIGFNQLIQQLSGFGLIQPHQFGDHLVGERAADCRGNLGNVFGLVQPVETSHQGVRQRTWNPYFITFCIARLNSGMFQPLAGFPANLLDKQRNSVGFGDNFIHEFRRKIHPPGHKIDEFCSIVTVQPVQLYVGHEMFGGPFRIKPVTKCKNDQYVKITGILL